MIKQERIAEILEAAGKATPGPWRSNGGSPSAIAGADNTVHVADAAPLDAAHIANCDPDTIIALCRMAQTKWISDKDPDKAGRYLVGGNGYVGEARFMPRKQVWKFPSAAMAFPVKAWMPLPAPPQESDDD